MAPLEDGPRSRRDQVLGSVDWSHVGACNVKDTQPYAVWRELVPRRVPLLLGSTQPPAGSVRSSRPDLSSKSTLTLGACPFRDPSNQWPVAESARRRHKLVYVLSEFSHGHAPLDGELGVRAAD